MAREMPTELGSTNNGQERAKLSKNRTGKKGRSALAKQTKRHLTKVKEDTSGSLNDKSHR